jgi:CRISPR-associated endonuclease Cas3-HD
MPLIQHLVDTGNVSALIWDRWLPESTKRIVRESFGGNEDTARSTLILLAGLHDIGKCTPSFAFNKHDCADSAVSGGFSLDGMHGESKGEYHSVTGQVILEHYLQDEMGATSQSARSLGIVIGSHHGVTPNAEDIATAVNKPLHTGMRDQKWADAQKEIIEFAINSLDLEHTTVKAIAAAGISTSAQIVLAGIVIMADWLASDTDNFAVVPAVDMVFTGSRAASAWSNMNLPGPWTPTSFTSAQDGLDTRFSTKDRTMTARPFQEVVVDMAQTHDGLLIVEAPMGEGKTEAALIAAETIAARNGAGGVFVALPTQATSNQMFSRTLQWLTRTTGIDESNVRSVYLAHGKALLNDEYSGLIGNDRMITAHRWMQGRKRGALAPFVVGTIDQILSAALQSKHLTMRHLALTNKVVILDEVHAVDTYMGSYLNRALEWLGFYGVPVIALSATLPSSIRKSLMKSYDTGRSKVAPPQKLSLASLLAKKNPQAAPVDVYANLEGDIGYPVISASMNGAAPVTRSVAPDSTRNKSIGINKLDDGLESLVNELDDLLVGAVRRDHPQYGQAGTGDVRGTQEGVRGRCDTDPFPFRLPREGPA